MLFKGDIGQVVRNKEVNVYMDVLEVNDGSEGERVNMLEEYFKRLRI